MRPSSEVERLHALIARAAMDLAAKDGPAVTLANVARATGRDPRTVRNHLRVMAMHNRILFLNREQTIFGLAGGIRRLLEAVAENDSFMEMGQVHFSQVNWPANKRPNERRRPR